MSIQAPSVFEDMKVQLMYYAIVLSDTLVEKSNPEMTLINFALLWAKNIVKADPAKINGDTKAWQAHIL